jgi:ribose transport system substrate-binding protein
MKKQVMAAISGLTMLGVLLGGCGNTAPAGSSAGTAGASAASEASASAEVQGTSASDTAETSGSGEKYCFYFPSAHAYGDEVSGYAEEYAKENGMNLKVMVGSDWEQETQDNNMRALMADGYSSIMAYPSTDGASGLFEELEQSGAKIVTYGASTSEQTELFSAATDVEKAAYTACEDTIEAMGGKGGILNVLEVLTDTNTLKRQKGVNDCIAAHDGVELVQEVAGINSIDEGVEKISSALAANDGKINGIVCTGNQSSSAAVQVLNDYYDRNPDAEKIILVTIDTPDDVMQGIDDGVVYGTIAQNTRAHGQVPLALLKLMNEGYEKKEGTFFIDTGCVLVTKDNKDSYSDDLQKLTDQIMDSLTTDYLQKA